MTEMLNQDSRPEGDQGLTREVWLHQAIEAFRSALCFRCCPARAARFPEGSLLDDAALSVTLSSLLADRNRHLAALSRRARLPAFVPCCPLRGLGASRHGTR